MELDQELAVEGVGKTEERVDPWRTASGLETGDGGLGRPAELGEFRLREAARPPLLDHLLGDLREEPPLFGVSEPLAEALDRRPVATSASHIASLLCIAGMQ